MPLTLYLRNPKICTITDIEHCLFINITKNHTHTHTHTHTHIYIYIYIYKWMKLGFKMYCSTNEFPQTCTNQFERKEPPKSHPPAQLLFSTTFKFWNKLHDMTIKLLNENRSKQTRSWLTLTTGQLKCICRPFLTSKQQKKNHTLSRKTKTILYQEGFQGYRSNGKTGTCHHGCIFHFKLAPALIFTDCLRGLASVSCSDK